MAGAAGSVIELSNYLEKRLSAKSAEYAAVRVVIPVVIFFLIIFVIYSMHCLPRSHHTNISPAAKYSFSIQ
jgi:hypothetical protein